MYYRITIDVNLIVDSPSIDLRNCLLLVVNTLVGIQSPNCLNYEQTIFVHEYHCDLFFDSMFIYSRLEYFSFFFFFFFFYFLFSFLFHCLFPWFVPCFGYHNERASFPFTTFGISLYFFVVFLFRFCFSLSILEKECLLSPIIHNSVVIVFFCCRRSFIKEYRNRFNFFD